MRPINLIISAFGPYAGKVEIEFDKFLDKGIYLIAGNTGAGKSTIFEAIKFALYGDDNGEIRSKYASDDAPTFVEMTFLLHGNEYKITRNPKYLRPKSRGEGSTVAKAEAELIYPDGKVISGYANVTKEINILTGLNSEQFSKIVMIAQGKFRELLVADTASRSKIFRDIFKTEPYDKLQKKIKAKYLEAYKENAKTNDSIKQFVQGIKSAEEYEKKVRLDNIVNQDIIADIDEVLDLASEIIELDQKAYQKNQTFLDEENVEIQEMGNKLLEDEKLIESIEALQKEFIKLKSYEEQFLVIKEVYDRENSLKGERDKLLVEIESEKKIVEKYKQYDELVDKLAKGKEKDSVLQDELSKASEDKKFISEKLIDIEAKQQVKLEKERQLMILEVAIKDNDEYQKKLQKINEGHMRLIEAQNKYEQKLQTFKEKEAQCDAIKANYSMAFKLFIEAQAGIMAKELEDNPDMPCPVCGSISHPKLAKYAETAPSEEEVNTLKLKLDKATNEVMTASNEAGQANIAKSSEKEHLLEIIAEVDSSLTLDSYYDNVCKMVLKAKEESDKFKNEKEKTQKELAFLEKELGKITNLKIKLEGFDEVIKNKENEINNNKLELKQLETNIENIKSELKSDSEELALESLSKKENMYKEMMTSYDKAVDEYNKNVNEKTQSKAIVEQLLKQLKELSMDKITDESLEQTRMDLLTRVEETKQQLEVVKVKRNNIIDANNNIFSRIQGNKQIIESVHVQKNNLSKIATRLSGLKTLSDTLNGEMEGKDKIKLETFVQISYFEQVIEKANTKLFEMTEGQYEFVRDVSSEDKRTKSGLELSVYDHYNGTIRSVKTLSGGEGFMAALSLALGMADIIEESASGIAIDTMFIDEGFGSLDEVALEQAMKVLSKLSEGNKLVGIISHVASLKDRIDKQINVEKHISGGSNVKVVV